MRPKRSNGMNEAPLFILGAPRSGTSLLFSCLAMHPRAAWISNWVRRFPQVPALATFNRIASRVPDRRHELWFGSSGDNAYVFDNARSAIAKLFPVPAEGEPVFARCGVAESSEASAGTAPSALRERLSSIRRFSGGDVLVNKRIANNRRVALLRETFPAARFVHLVRDGRAVAASLRKVGWWADERIWWLDGSTSAALEASGHDGWDLAAGHWVAELGAIDDGLAGIDDELQAVYRYEDLVGSPHETLGAIAEFAGLGPDSQWAASVARVQFPNRSQTWRSTLDDAAVETIEQRQRPLLEQYGYLP
jgi:hypothetical protein